MIGEGSILGTSAGAAQKRKTKISNSVIGNNCIIGDNVTIRNSIIWETVTIADNCHIENALICENVVIGEGASIFSGAMIDKGVHIKPKSEIS